MRLYSLDGVGFLKDPQVETHEQVKVRALVSYRLLSHLIYEDWRLVLKCFGHLEPNPMDSIAKTQFFHQWYICILQN